MDSRTHDRTPSEDAVEFVRFCYRRRAVGWPELYDEMCGVANRGLFRGWTCDDLGAAGINFSLFELPALATLVHRVVAEEHARRAQIASAAVVRAAAAEAPVAEESPRVIPEPAPEPAVVATLRFAGAAAGG
ncbi:MAG TPA: hypothetical protein VKA85_03290 [Candidatus Limnocylindrales bacterium]|nr:hypothetical protein [Candidatus Limnocylindrales bacterium]